MEPTVTVNDITARFPETIAVFNDFGVDACCGGDLRLVDAAARDGVDLQALTEALAKAIGGSAVTTRA